MNDHFKMSKTVILIIFFLFLFGSSVVISQSSFLYKLNIENGKNETSNYVSALSQEELENFRQDKILLVYDPDSEESFWLKDHFEKTLQYMKKPFETVTYSQVPDHKHDFQNIVILFSDLDKTGDFTSFTSYVSEGGKLFFAIHPDTGSIYSSIHQMLGIKQTEPPYVDTFGVRMASDLLLQSKNIKVIDEEYFTNISLGIDLEDSSKVYAFTGKGIPLLFSTPYGNGEFMVFNGTMLLEKVNRGLIAGSLSYLNEDYIYPIINSKVMYIDDFPAPFPEGTNEDIYQDYKLDTASFFHDIWWPDMLMTAKRNDVTYTGVLVETYNDKINGSFEERLVEENLLTYGQDLIKMGGELGVHGYNHQSLTKDQKQVAALGYNAWKEEADMVQSLTAINQHIKEIFPGYTLQTYVPPSNVLSEEGKKAIKEAIPSITNIASLYIPDGENVSYIQEFESTNEFNEIPRFTSNYLYKDETKWTIANASTLFGVFSHFIHPDDILDEKRSELKSWKQLSKEFNQMLQDVKEKYPWMESQTASESAMNMKNYQNANVFISQNDQKINGYINHFAGNLDFILRSDKEIVRTNGCEVEKISSDRYLIHAQSAKFTIELGVKQ